MPGLVVFSHNSEGCRDLSHGCFSGGVGSSQRFGDCLEEVGFVSRGLVVAAKARAIAESSIFFGPDEEGTQRLERGSVFLKRVFGFGVFFLD